MKLLACLCCVLILSACSSSDKRVYEEEGGQFNLSERDLPLPAFPRPEALIEFHVSDLTHNHFYIDPASLRVESDGTVAYTLVVKTAGGATNISYEGMNCHAAKRRLYATGRSDGTWAKARNSDWQVIDEKPVNRHHAALSKEFFCAEGLVLRDAAEGVDALRRGKHPPLFKPVLDSAN